jgi:hypothetical protein
VCVTSLTGVLVNSILVNSILVNSILVNSILVKSNLVKSNLVKSILVKSNLVKSILVKSNLVKFFFFYNHPHPIGPSLFHPFSTTQYSALLSSLESPAGFPRPALAKWSQCSWMSASTLICVHEEPAVPKWVDRTIVFLRWAFVIFILFLYLWIIVRATNVRELRIFFEKNLFHTNKKLVS